MKNEQVIKRDKYVHFLSKGLIAPRGLVNVVLIGAGGTGTALLSGLARINYSLIALGHPGLTVHVFDGDTVSDSNIGRQLFSEADLGLNKATVQVTRINNFFGFRWRAIPEMFTKTHMEPIDSEDERIPLVISAVDNAKARILIRRAIRGKAVYWLDTGNTINSGQVILGTVTPVGQPKRKDLMTVESLPTVVDLYSDIEEQDKGSFQGPSCSLQEALRRQDLFINQQVATSALRLLWRGLRKGMLAVSGYFVNMDSATPERSLPIDPDLWKRMGWKESRSGKDLPDHILQEATYV